MKISSYLLSITFLSIFVISFSGCKKNNDSNDTSVCRITSPTNGQEIVKGETVTISAEVDDIAGNVVEVRYYIDGVGKTSVNSFPFNYDWNTSGYALGAHTIKASSVGYAGVLGSDEITITLTDGIPGNYSPIANFSASTTSGEAPLEVKFTDQSTNNPTGWYWEFGDGESSNIQNPDHTFTADGFYSVKLIATNEYGSDTLVKGNYINVGGGGSGNPCPGTPTVTDADGNVYNTVQIGSQCWMRENLRVGTTIEGSMNMTDNNIIEKYCYDDDPSNCEVFGGLYQWNEIMNYSEVEGTQGICPSGWHIPSDQDWKYLEMHLGMSQAEADLQGWRGDTQGEELKSKTGWNSNGNGTNSSGFTAYPGGYRSGEFEDFNELGNLGFWWSSTKFSENQPWYRAMSIYVNEVGREYNYDQSGISVRCVKDYQ